jgi:hypothetical protein
MARRIDAEETAVAETDTDHSEEAKNGDGIRKRAPVEPVAPKPES